MKSEAVKELEKIAMEYNRKKYPAVPDCALVKPKYNDESTNDLQTCIVDYLDFIGGWGVRVNVQGQYIQKLQRHIPSSTKRGTPDIIGCLPNGKFIGIECKQPGEKLRESQDEIRQDIIEANGLHLVAFVGQFQRVYDSINSLSGRRIITPERTVIPTQVKEYPAFLETKTKKRI